MFFVPKKPCRRGHSAWRSDGRCAECRKIASKRWYENNKELTIARTNEWVKNNYVTHIQRVRDWQRRNPEKKKQISMNWAKQNPERVKSLILEWNKKNKGKLVAYSRKYQTQKIQAMPKWLTKNDLWMIDEIYDLAQLRSELTGIKWHVDHKFPLQGKTVCGLHVPLNLQVIPATDNVRKSNKCL